MNKHTYLYCWGPAPLRGCRGLLKPLLSVGLMICCNQLYNLNLNVQGCDWLSGIVCLLLQIYVPWGLNFSAEFIQCFLCDITLSFDYVFGLPDPFSHLRDRLRGWREFSALLQRSNFDLLQYCLQQNQKRGEGSCTELWQGERGLGNKLSSSITISLVGGAYNNSKIAF